MANYDRTVTLAQELSSIIRDAEEIKASQYMGNDIVTIKESSTASVYDLSLAGYGYAYRKLIFEADKQNSINGIFRFRICTDASMTTLASSGNFSFAMQDLTTLQGSPTKLVYEANIYNNIASTLYFKLYVYATDIGTVSLTP